MRQSSVPVATPADDDFERNLRRMLVSRAPAVAPRELHESISIVTTEGTGLMQRVWTQLRGGYAGGRLSAPAVGMAFVMLVVLVVGAGALGLVLTRQPSTLGAAGGAQTISWHANSVTLKAASVTIDVNGRRFDGQTVPASVSGDPGDAAYRTLEIVWHSGQQEMRLNMYFKSDGTNWWASEIRTYDGTPNSKWLLYPADLVTAPVGAAFQGDLDVASVQGAVPGHLVIRGMSLTAFQPNDGPRTLEGCKPVKPVPANAPQDFVAGDPIGAGEPLAGLGLQSMSPKAISDVLLAKGYCHTFRLSWSYSDFPNAGYTQMWCTPPPGVVGDFAYGSSGEVIVFVTDPVERPSDRNTPARIGC
jgi:hypothetical protein